MRRFQGGEKVIKEQVREKQEIAFTFWKVKARKWKRFQHARIARKI